MQRRLLSLLCLVTVLVTLVGLRRRAAGSRARRRADEGPCRGRADQGA